MVPENPRKVYTRPWVSKVQPSFQSEGPNKITDMVDNLIDRLFIMLNKTSQGKVTFTGFSAFKLGF